MRTTDPSAGAPESVAGAAGFVATERTWDLAEQPAELQASAESAYVVPAASPAKT